MCFEFFLVCVGVDCLRVISRVKDLERWASAFSASCGFRNLCIKSGYEKSRVTSTRHKARCMVCMKDVDISSMGEFALTSHLKGKKTSNNDIPEKVITKHPRFVLAFLLKDQQLQVMMPK